MKLQVVSDLHLEFSDDPGFTNQGADVLVLAGDVCLAEHLYRNPNPLPGYIQKGSYAAHAVKYRKFFERVSKEWPVVLYVLGNHEHYSGLWNRTADVMRDELAAFPNVHLLDDEKFELYTVVFYGTTLWTDLNRSDPLTAQSLKTSMNDYRVVTETDNGTYHKLNPTTTYKKHKSSLAWLTSNLEDDQRTTVVVGHHAPSMKSIHPRYAGQHYLNGGYASDLENVMHDHDHVKLWIHGHVHDPFDYMVHKTRVLCNPHGYPHELRWNPTLVVEV